MKLVFVHQNQDSRGGGEEHAMKKEEVETAKGKAEVCASLAKEPVEEDMSVPESWPLLDSNPLLVSGKRKRKPKELIDEICPITIRRRKKFTSSKLKDGLPDSGATPRSKADINRSGSIAQMKSPTMIRAEEFQLSLSNAQPSFLKSCVRSHVASCFWMVLLEDAGLPGPFCKIHLPDKDTEVMLENEHSEEFPIKYIANKTGLSAGWRKFVSGNKLVEGDVLIFQLIGPCRFKVHIIRANDLTEVDGALSLLILDSKTKQNDAEGTTDPQSKKRRRPKSLPLTVVQKKQNARLPEEQSGNDSDEVASEVSEGTKVSGSFHFKDVKSFEEFGIVVNGVCINSELPEDIRRKYYDLCSSKKSFLHDHLLPGLYSKLAAGMIVETIHIADFIRRCSPTTPRKDFEVWEKSLRSFELLGLNVGFLRSRLNQLLRLAFESEGASEIRKYREVQEKQGHAQDEIQKLEAKLSELREFSARCDNEIENLRMKTERYLLKFQEEVDAPW